MVSATNANALFALLGVANAPAIEAKMAAIEPWLSLKIQDGEWLIVAPAATTAKEVSDRLGITGPPGAPFVTTGIVVRIDGYFGRSPQSNWEWIVAKLGAPLGTAAVQS